MQQVLRLAQGRAARARRQQQGSSSARALERGAAWVRGHVHLGASN